MPENNCTTGIISQVEVPVPNDECACIGVSSISFNALAGTFTIVLTDGSTYTSPDLRGLAGVMGATGLTGPTGATGVAGPAVEMRYDLGTNYLQYRVVGSLTWIDLVKINDYTNETWKEIKVVSTDIFADGTPVPSFALGTGATGSGKVLIRKRYNGDVDIVFNTFFLNATNYLPVFTIPVTPTGYRINKIGYFHISCENADTVIGNAIVDATGLVTLTLPTAKTFSGGAGGGCTVNGYISFSTI